ncbi:MAG TPA: hypothetical protein VIK95_00165 [Egibacteraceae bacterium]
MDGPGELLLLAVLAGVWWIPTFLCLNDLQNREGVRRVLVWKWTAVLCVPAVGAAAYWFRGRAELDADLAAQRRFRRGVAPQRSGRGTTPKRRTSGGGRHAGR